MFTRLLTAVVIAGIITTALFYGMQAQIGRAHV